MASQMAVLLFYRCPPAVKWISMKTNKQDCCWRDVFVVLLLSKLLEVYCLRTANKSSV